MIRIDPQIIVGIRKAATPGELQRYLKMAVKLEHSTIPPYLTAMFSLKPGVNDEIVRLIRSIVVEEMLHMTIASNILLATGGTPEINKKGFVPTYPGPLPMDIGGLIVGIEPFSMPLVKNIFMAIEEPEHEVPVHPPDLLLATETFATIGQFYDAIKDLIRSLGSKIFVNTTAPPQVVDNYWFPAAKLFPITSPDCACAAIDIIKLEGEGTSSSPFQSPDDPAHFYKFGEIYYGRHIVITESGFSYNGTPVLFDPSAVWPLKPNCKIGDFRVGSQARTRIERFAYSYATLLNALQNVFDGEPESPGRPKTLNAAIGMMYDLRVFAVDLMQTDANDDVNGGPTVGPSFEYVDVQGGMK